MHETHGQRCVRCGLEMQVVGRVSKDAGRVSFLRCRRCRKLTVEVERPEAASRRRPQADD